jgi:hypothetical protein
MNQSTRSFGFNKMRRRGWARTVSDLLSPPVIWALLAFPIAMHDADTKGHAIMWALLYGTLVCWLPMLYVAWKVHNGTITDLHMQERAQRIRPLMVTMGAMLTAIAILLAFNAPRLLPMFAFFSLLQILIITVITFVWQISLHAMSIGGAVVTAGALFGPVPALALSPLVVVVGAARLKLHRHTLSQVIAGAAVGASMAMLLFTVT